MGYCFKLISTHAISMNNWIFLCGDTQGIAFTCVKWHLPFTGPFRINWSIKQTVICKQTEFCTSVEVYKSKTWEDLTPFPGTPDLTGAGHEHSPSTTTLCVLDVSHVWIQCKMVPRIPKKSSFWSKRCRGTVSKAFWKSNINTSVWILLSMFQARSSMVMISCDSHECCDLNLLKSGQNIKLF